MIPTGNHSFQAVHISSFKQIWVKYLVCRVAAVSFHSLRTDIILEAGTYFVDYTLFALCLYTFINGFIFRLTAGSGLKDESKTQTLSEIKRDARLPRLY